MMGLSLIMSVAERQIIRREASGERSKLVRVSAILGISKIGVSISRVAKILTNTLVKIFFGFLIVLRKLCNLYSLRKMNTALKLMATLIIPPSD